jgi:hypothetical protein
VSLPRTRKTGFTLAALSALLIAARAAVAEEPPPAKLPSEPAPCAAEAVKPIEAAVAPRLVKFAVSPFPYHGKVPADGKPFLDHDQNGQRGHTSPRGNLHLEADAYSDQRSLLFLPAGFDLSHPEKALIVVFFHGNYARLEQDVERRQRVPQQLAASGLNAALVAPQFAVNIADSSAGKFWEDGVFGQYLKEAAKHLAELRNEPCTEAIFDRIGVVLVAYSGGYDPAAYALAVGGADPRIRGVILLDALYGEIDKFSHWIAESAASARPGFFFSAYSGSSRPENVELQHQLSEQHISFDQSPKLPQLKQGSVAFLFAGSDIPHKDFVTSAWVSDPLKAALSAIEGFRIAVKPAHPVGPRKARPATHDGKPPPAR